MSVNINNNRTMFMVLSSWLSHCESSPSSHDDCRTAPGGCRPLHQANRLEPLALV